MRCYVERVLTDRDVTADVKTLIPDAGLRRRMSRVIRSAVATAMECVGGVAGVKELDAIITATGWGCIADSEKFLRNLIAEREQLLNPTPFIQSTFNTIGGHIALLGGNHCYNVTYVNRSHSFEDALLDAAMRVEDGEGDNLLVGAFDEQTASQHRIMERMGAFRTERDGEGAMFTLIRANGQGCVAQLTVIDFPSRSLSAEECMERYAKSEEAELLYNNFREYGLFPTASAQSFAEAVRRIECGVKEVVVYNEYMGATPTVLRLECIG